MRPVASAFRFLVLFGACVGSSRPAVAQELLVGSWRNHSIRRYDLDTGEYLGDFVAPGSGGLNVPDGMDWGPDGNLYVSSSESNAILKFDGDDGQLLGEFSTEGLRKPGHLKFGPDGMLYVTNKEAGEVLRFDVDTADREVFVSGVREPVGLLWNDGLLYVSEFSGNAIQRFDAETGDKFDTFANLNSPLILNRDVDGDILVSSHSDSTIWEYDADTGERLGRRLSGRNPSCPVGYLFFEDELIVTSWWDHRILRYQDDGDFSEVFTSGAGLLRPNDLLLRPVAIPEPGTWGMAWIGLIVWRFACRRLKPRRAS